MSAWKEAFKPETESVRHKRRWEDLIAHVIAHFVEMRATFDSVVD